MKYGKKGAGRLPVLTVVLIILGVLIFAGAIAGIVFGITTLSVTPTVVVDYDGEFDDAYLAIKGDFYSDFTEGTDCNITGDVLGGSAYTACIYDTASDMDSLGANSTEYQLDLVIDIDGDVENCEIEGTLQNTGTGQAKDDVIIKEVNLQTYDDEPVIVYDGFIIDNEDGEFEGETGVLAGEEYVLHILIKTKLITPEFADGDDIMKITLDLTTDGDADAARITLEE